MYGHRQLKEFNKFEEIKPEPRIVHQTLDAYQDDSSYTKFDLRSSGMNAHMSSTMFLERRFTVQIQQVNRIPEEYALSEDSDHTRVYRPIDIDLNGDRTHFIRKPGFMLQENTKSINFDCNAGTMECDTRFLNAYSKLYKDKLKQYVRGSGRSFSNHKDDVRRGYGLNTVSNNKWSGTESYVYVNHERNERRIPARVYKNATQIDNQGNAYWYDAPWDVQPSDHYMDQDFEDQFEDSDLFPPGGFIEHKTDHNGNLMYHHDAQGATQPTYDELPGTSYIASDAFKQFYEKYWKTADEAAETDFLNSTRSVFSNGKIIDPDIANDISLWDNIRQQYEHVFATLNDAIQHEVFSGRVSADASYEDKVAQAVTMGFTEYLGWGVDLTQPFDGSRKMYIKTATRMLQFAFELIKYHNAEDSMFAESLKEINALKEDLVLMEDARADAETSVQGRYNAIQILNEVDDPDEDQLEEREYLEQDMAYVLGLYANEYGFPDSAEPTQGGDTYMTQVNAIVDAARDNIDAHIMAFDQDTEALSHSAINQNPSQLKKAVQVFSRIYGYMTDDAAKEKFTFGLKNSNLADIVVFEPIIVGPCKPSEYCDVGCWKENSNIIPYIDRFQLSVQWKSIEDYFELDQYPTYLVVADEFSHQVFYPRLAIIDVKSRLHVNFVEHPVAIPAALPIINTDTIQIAQVSTIRNQTQTISFRDIDLRRKPKHIMIHCVAKPGQDFDGIISSDKSASIVSFKLRTDIQYKSLEANNVEYVNALTSRNFPDYIPPSGLTGNVLCINMNELPQAKTPSEYIHLLGEVVVCQDWAVELEYFVFITLFYGDTYWQINQNYQRGVLDLN